MGSSVAPSAPLLIADDDLYVRAVIRKHLQDQGDIIEAESGDKVLELYKQYRPRLVLLDVHIQNSDGFQLLQEILAFDPHAHIVMISSDAIRTNVLRSIQCGAMGFIGKPFEKDILLRYLNYSALLGRPQEAAIAADNATVSG